MHMYVVLCRPLSADKIVPSADECLCDRNMSSTIELLLHDSARKATTDSLRFVHSCRSKLILTCTYIRMMSKNGCSILWPEPCCRFRGSPLPFPLLSDPVAFPWWAILAIALGAVLIVATILVVCIVCCCLFRRSGTYEIG